MGRSSFSTNMTIFKASLEKYLLFIFLGLKEQKELCPMTTLAKNSGINISKCGKYATLND